MKYLLSLLTVVALVVGCVARPSGIPDLPPIIPPSINPFKNDVSGYGWLDWAAGIGTLVAIAFALGSVWVPGPKMRATAAAGVGIAVGAWVLKFLLVKYMVWACLVAAILALLATAGYIWGHRKWFEKHVNLDLDGDGSIGDEPVRGTVPAGGHGTAGSTVVDPTQAGSDPNRAAVDKGNAQ